MTQRHFVSAGHQFSDGVIFVCLSTPHLHSNMARNMARVVNYSSQSRVTPTALSTGVERKFSYRVLYEQNGHPFQPGIHQHRECGIQNWPEIVVSGDVCQAIHSLQRGQSLY